MSAIECGDPSADCAGAGGAEAGTSGAGQGGRAKGRGGPKGQGTPLAKPKAKPKPQPQAPHSPSPHPPPLVARKSAAAVPAEDPEVEEVRGSSKEGRTKVSQWENKLASLRVAGDADRIRMAEANLRKAKEKVAEKEEAIEGFDRAVRRSEREFAAVVARVKEEGVDQVVELDVEAEEMEEEIVKEKEEANVVVATPARGGGGLSQWLRGMIRLRDAGAPPRPGMGPGCAGWPPPPEPGHSPPRRPEESGMDSPLFVGAGAPPAVWGGAVGMGGREGVIHLDKPLRLGVANGWWGWQRGLPGPGKGWGEVPAPRNGGEDVPVGANQHFHPREEKGGGAPTGDSSPTVGRG